MIPLFADRVDDLQKLKKVGEWEPRYGKFEHVCAGCLTKLTRKLCALCSKPFDVVEDARDLLISNLIEHKPNPMSLPKKVSHLLNEYQQKRYQEGPQCLDKKHICPDCFQRNRFARCVRCGGSLNLKENCSPNYSQDENLRIWLSPYHDEWKNHSEYESGVLCLGCYNQLKAAASAVIERFENWAGGTKGEYLRGYETKRVFGLIEENKRVEDPAAVAHNLKFYAAQKGGNGYIQFFWERHTESLPEKYVAGYGPKGNPYYRTKYSTEVWYTGYATAIWAERRSGPKNKQPHPDDQIIKPSPWRKPRDGEGGSPGQTRWTRN
jgi:hypothetical protein